MNQELTSQLYMLMGLSQLGGFNNIIQNENIYIRILIPILVAFSPFIIKFITWLYEYIEYYIYMDSDESIVSIRFPVHEVKVHKDGYGKDSSTRQLYSINYLAVNDYIRDNLDKINGISNLVEILNVRMDYYSEDTNEKNFILIPADSTEILIESNSKIYCKIRSTEKLFERKDDNDNKKEKNSNDKVKTYELLLFIKLLTKLESEKKSSMILLNKFVKECIDKYNKKNEEKHEGKHWIYEYSHSFKDEYSGLDLNFKEYLFENNKDLDKNIFFEGKDKLIKYVDKFIYDNYLSQTKIPNKYEEEYKSIGYTYKATFLFYGFPGCGKTSTIKAILNRTKRHGIIINWNKIKTCEELETLFRTRRINHKDYDARELCYIIEDCDASKNNILLSRKKTDSDISNDPDDLDNLSDIDELDDLDILNNLNNTELSNDNLDDNYDNGNLDENLDDKNSDDKIKKMENKKKIISIRKLLKKFSKSSKFNLTSLKLNDDSLNLSCLLNILDGIIELHGVMVIFTTNYPEKLDEAFLRPGRIDFKQEFNRASIETMYNIIKSKFSTIDNLNNYKLFNYVLSPAEIQSICFKNDNFDECIEELEKETIKYSNRIKNI